MELSITTIAAMGAGVGVLVIGLTIFIVVLLIRARREHNRHMAELEERGIAIVRTQKDAERESVTRPRAVLRRDTTLPFNSKSGWGNLPSVETISPLEPPSVPLHYVPSKPPGFVPKSKRLSWSFLGRRTSKRAIPMRKIRGPVLSTVLESPKPSPLVPVLIGPLGDASSPRRSQSRPSSDQSLLQHHPALRKLEQKPEARDEQLRLEPLRRSLTAKLSPRTETYTLPNRSQSVADLSISKIGSMSRPQLHGRSVSTSSQASGNPPDGGLPLLPLEIARIKSEARRRSLLSRSPSHKSNSSYESTGSSILASQSSPTMRSPNNRVQKTAKRDLRNCAMMGPRPFRDTLTLHGKNKPSQGSIRSNAARSCSALPTTQAEKQSSQLPTSSSLQSLARVKASSPVGSPFAIRNSTTPKRRSGSFVTPYGSPEHRSRRSSVLQSVSGNQGAPKRQLSQASTQASSSRSSNENPFQWDPSPVSSGKPSALKGSPSARKPGHKRQNCVRISLIPTMLGPQTRTPSPAIHDIAEESPQAISEQLQNVDTDFLSTKSLQQPPSTSIFAPDLKFNTTSIRASLTASSPTLSMANFDHSPVGTPVKIQPDSILQDISQQDQKRSSAGSISSLPTYPNPSHDIAQSSVMISPPPKFGLSQPVNEYGEDTRPYDETEVVSSPFEVLPDIATYSGGSSLLDEYDPESPYFSNQTPIKNLTRSFSSPFSTILEEPSSKSDRSADPQQPTSEDSPPCSPKTIPSESFPDARDSAAYNLPIRDTAIPEEPLDTIDPAILSKDAFTSLNTPFDNKSGSIIKGPRAYQDVKNMRTNSIGATYQRQSLAPPPMAPSSPRPAHAQLPPLSFAGAPTLAPCGPRGPPPRSLRASIQTLRRMNSEVKQGGKAERRYTNLGREDSIALPGEESWLEDLDRYEEEGNEAWANEKSRSFLGDLGFDWEEEATVLDLDITFTPTTTTIPPRSTSCPSVSAATIEEGSTRAPNQDEKAAEKQKSAQDQSVSRPTSPSTAAHHRCSSIWEDGEKFWTSTPPYSPITSPNKPTDRFIPLSSSPMSTRSARKRAFEVAKDEAPAQEDATLNIKENEMEKGKDKDKEKERKKEGSRYRKRNVLGVGTPNVKICVVPPSNDGTEEAPGSLYDGEGFLMG